MISTEQLKKLMGKLRQPISFDFISKNVLELDEKETQEILNQLIERDEIVKYDDYYKLKKKIKNE